MKPEQQWNGIGRHLTDEEVALWVEAMAENRLHEIPEGIREHIEQCESCREMVAENAAVLMPAVMHETATGHPAPAKTREMRSGYFVFRIAAALLVLVTVGTLLYLALRSGQQDHRRLYAGYFSPYPDLITKKTNSSGYKPDQLLLSLAMSYYAHGNYDSAMFVFTNLLEMYPGNDTLRFYLGVTMLALPTDTMNPEEVFSFLIEKNSAFETQSRWYLALTHLKNGEIDGCREVLGPLLQGPEFYRKKAEALLRELKN